MKKIIRLVCFLVFLFYSVSALGFSTENSAAQIDSILQQALLGEALSDQQVNEIQSILTFWYKHLEVNKISPDTVTYEQLSSATQGWVTWLQTVTALGLAGEFENADV